MSGETRYDVVLSLSTEGSLSAKVGDLGAKAESTNRSLRGMGDGARDAGESAAAMGERFGGALEGIADQAIETALHLGKLGAIAGTAAIAYGVGHLNNELEQTQMSLGAIAQAQGFASTFERGFALAGDELAQMKQDVKTLPGDLGQLSNAMKMIATPAAQAKASMDQIEKLAAKTMLVGTILGVQNDVGSREMAGLLAGRAGSHNILGARLGFIGDSAKKLNAAAPEVRLALINTELAKYQGAADRFGQSFIANFTTLKDNVKYGLLAEATSPLFERVKHSMAEINTYFDDHKEKVKEIADTIGHRLVGGWDELENRFKRIEPVVAKIADHILHMQPAEIGKKLEEAGKAALALKVGGMAISAGSSLIPRLMAGGAGGAGAAEGGMMALLPAMGVAFGTVAAAAIPVAGALDDLTDASRKYHDADVILAERLGQKMEQVSAAIDPSINSIRALADSLGNELLKEANNAARDLLFLANAAGDVSHMFHLFSRTNFWTNGAHGDWKKDLESIDTFDRSKDVPGGIKDHEIADLMDHHDEAFGNGRAAKDEAQLKARPSPSTTIQKVEIVVSGSSDPSRVSRLVLDEFKKLVRNPTSSPHVPNYASTR